MGKTKDKRLRRIYKISEREFNREIRKQGGGCAICGRPFPEYLAFQDHFHGCCARKKKEYCGLCNRGVLCFGCNKFLVGVIEKMYAQKRYPVDWNKMAAYLNKWKEILTLRGVWKGNG